MKEIKTVQDLRDALGRCQRDLPVTIDGRKILTIEKMDGSIDLNSRIPEDIGPDPKETEKETNRLKKAMEGLPQKEVKR